MSLKPIKKPKTFYFEIAWEVVNKVGGIHTVIKSKAPVTVNELGTQYCMLGTYDSRFASTDVDIREPTDPLLEDALNVLRKNGARVYSGKWLIEGYPNVILFDLASVYNNIEGWRLELSEKFQIHVPWNDKEGSDVIVFGGVVAWFINEVGKRLNRKRSICAHFHEWLSAVGLIFIKKWRPSVATIFTTHATLMGRHLSAAQHDIYQNLAHFNLDKEAGDRKIYHCYCIERAAAHTADIFTTVSHVTADEATMFIAKKPDIITPNGLNVIKYSVLHEFQNKHSMSKCKINKFVSGHFSGNYDFDLDRTLYFFSAGRYEYSNKGVDLLLAALSRLNGHLKSINSDLTVVVFLIFPTAVHHHNVESLKGQALFKQLVDTINEIKNKVGEKLLDSVSRRTLPDADELLDCDDIMKMKKYLISSKRALFPPICTHNVVDDAGDPILCTLRHYNLVNDPNDRVKVVFHPEFLNSTSPLFPMDYEEFVRGCHLGIFCSYYEPWGYTPAECTVMGVPSVTSNLTGFGEYMYSKVSYPDNYGVYIVDRRFQSFDESASQLTDYLIRFSSQNKRQRVVQRNRCERLSELLDWKLLGKYYKKARQNALHKVNPKKYERYENTIDDNEILNSLSVQLRRSLSMSTFTEEDDYEFSCYDDEDEDDEDSETQTNSASNKFTYTNGSI